MTLAERYREALTAWQSSRSDSDAATLVETENEVCEYLNISLDQTEQGLTPQAQERIDIWLEGEEADAKFLRKFGEDTGN